MIFLLAVKEFIFVLWKLGMDGVSFAKNKNKKVFKNDTKQTTSYFTKKKK